jgi:hypothetical protein
VIGGVLFSFPLLRKSAISVLHIRIKKEKGENTRVKLKLKQEINNKKNRLD